MEKKLQERPRPEDLIKEGILEGMFFVSLILRNVIFLESWKEKGLTEAAENENPITN